MPGARGPIHERRHFAASAAAPSSGASACTMALPWLESLPVWGASRPAAARRRSGSPPCSWATASARTHWWAKGAGADMELSKSLEPLAAVPAAAERHLGPVQQARDRRRHPSRADRQHPLRARRCRRGPCCAAASAWTRCSPRTSARRPPSRAWCWAASSRSPATTRRTSRWPTARTSPGRTPTRRCRWRSTRRWPSTASSTTRAAGGRSASSTASRSRPRRSTARSSHADQAKLDEYLTSVREVEKRDRAHPRRRRTGPTTGPATAAGPRRDAPARQRPARGHPRAHAADVRHHRAGLPDRQDARRHAAAVPRPLRACSTRSSTCARPTTRPRTRTTPTPTSA